MDVWTLHIEGVKDRVTAEDKLYTDLQHSCRKFPSFQGNFHERMLLLTTALFAHSAALLTQAPSQLSVRIAGALPREPGFPDRHAKRSFVPVTISPVSLPVQVEWYLHIQTDQKSTEPPGK